MWTLTIEDEEGTRTRIPLARDAYFVGREKDNEVCLSERNISRKHAQIRRDTDGWVVEDLDSYNGTYINGARVVGEGKLADGDILQLGDYRLEFVDEASVAVDLGDLEAEISASDTAAQRPARLVVVVGPTVGQEFPLGTTRVTIGRAEEADLIIQHASISRIHAEIVPLSNGHYEVIDSQSANGIRINGVDLKRGILEAGDALELGDVRLRFVAKGKVFRFNADQSQQLAAFHVEALPAAELSNVPSIQPAAPKSSSKYMVLGLGLGAVCLIGVLAMVLGAPAPTTPTAATDTAQTAAPDTSVATIAEAQALADKGDLEGAHAKIATIGEVGAHQSADVAAIESSWAESIFKKVAATDDAQDKRKLLQSVAITETVDATTRKRALDEIAALDAASTKPAAAQQPIAENAGSYEEPAPGSTPAATSTAARSTTSKPGATASAKPTGKVSDSSGYAAQRRALEPRVWSGKATEQEIRLLRAICTHMGDSACRNRASAMLAAKK